MSILFLAKTTPWCDAARRFVLTHGADVTVCDGERDSAAPAAFETWTGDYVVSFLSPWIVPARVLDRARKAAINFHPGPPEYPGIGCYNFAIYDRAPEFGVTCHHMAPKVDTGALVRVARFPMLAGETVETLKDRTMVCLLSVFYDVMTRILRDGTVPESSERWARRPYTRHELEDLCRITVDMPGEEIDRRVQATVFPGAPGPWLELGSHRFVRSAK